MSDDQATKPAEDERKIFVGGLPSQATEDDIRNYFSKYGVVEICNLKIDQETQRSRGFAFITFSKVEEVQLALSPENVHEICGKKIDPKKATPQQKNEPDGKVFVGGLDRATTEDDIRDAFSTYGKVTEIFLPTDKATGEGKGYAFVSFEDTSLPATLVAQEKIEIKQTMCEIKKARNKSESNRGGFRGGRGGRGGYGGYGYGGGYDMYGGGYGGNFNQYGGGGQYGGGYGGQGYGGEGGYGGQGGGYGGYGQGGYNNYGNYGGQYQNKMKGGRGGGSGYQPY